MKVKNPILTIKVMMITLIIFAMIMVVAYFARQKITSWRTYAAVGSLSRVDASRRQLGVPKRDGHRQSVVDDPFRYCNRVASVLADAE